MKELTQRLEPRVQQCMPRLRQPLLKSRLEL